MPLYRSRQSLAVIRALSSFISSWVASSVRVLRRLGVSLKYSKGCVTKGDFSYFYKLPIIHEKVCHVIQQLLDTSLIP